MPTTYGRTDLEKLEAEAVHIIGEVAATIEPPGMLYSGGNDSVVMPHLAVNHEGLRSQLWAISRLRGDW